MRREGWGRAVKGIMRMIWSIEPYGHGGMGAGDERRREGGRPSLLEILDDNSGTKYDTRAMKQYLKVLPMPSSSFLLTKLSSRRYRWCNAIK